MTESLRRVQAGDAMLAVAEVGAGRPLLLVHGFPLDHSMWRGQLDALGRRYRVIAPDLRGFGQSGDVEPGATMTMERYADDLARLLDALRVDEPVVYCGLSMGGYIAWPFVWRHRQRLGGLILCDTRAEPDAPTAAAARLESARRVLEEGSGILADAMLPRLLAAHTLEARPELVEAIRATIRAAPSAGVAAALRGMAERPDATPWLSHIDCPTLVVVGAEDALTTPEQMRAMAARIPGAQAVEIDSAGHLTPYEQPEAFNAAVEAFLKP